MSQAQGHDTCQKHGHTADKRTAHSCVAAICHPSVSTKETKTQVIPGCYQKSSSGVDRALQAASGGSLWLIVACTTGYMLTRCKRGNGGKAAPYLSLRSVVSCSCLYKSSDRDRDRDHGDHRSLVAHSAAKKQPQTRYTWIHTRTKVWAMASLLDASPTMHVHDGRPWRTHGAGLVHDIDDILAPGPRHAVALDDSP